MGKMERQRKQDTRRTSCSETMVRTMIVTERLGMKAEGHDEADGLEES